MHIDKDELLAKRKSFGRIFLNYLLELPDHQSSAGQQMLTNRLLQFGQEFKATEVKKLEFRFLVSMVQGKRGMSHWLSFTALQLALQNGFNPTHPADSLGIAISYMDEYKSAVKPKLIGSIDPFMDYIEHKTGIRLPSEHQAILIDYMRSKCFYLDAEAH